MGKRNDEYFFFFFTLFRFLSGLADGDLFCENDKLLVLNMKVLTYFLSHLYLLHQYSRQPLQIPHQSNHQLPNQAMKTR